MIHFNSPKGGDEITPRTGHSHLEMSGDPSSFLSIERSEIGCESLPSTEVREKRGIRQPYWSTRSREPPPRVLRRGWFIFLG